MHVYKYLVPLSVILLLTSCATSGDLEATRSHLEQANQQAAARINEMETKLSNDKLLDMFRQVETLKADIVKTKGDIEVLDYNLQSLQKRQNDLYNDLDGRLAKLESALSFPGSVGAHLTDSASASATGQNTANPAAEYEEAIALLKSNSFAKATEALNQFIGNYPQASQVPEASYWLGISHTALRQYDAAIDIHRRFVEKYPDQPLAPEALRNIANCQRALGQVDQAKSTLKRLIKRYPKSDAAEKASQQLSNM